jgi:hypothetical protein
MKYRRAHKRNGVQYQAGDKFTGLLHEARFLYQRGALESDGDPIDADVMRSPGKRAAQRWGIFDDVTDTSDATSAWSDSGDTKE